MRLTNNDNDSNNNNKELLHIQLLTPLPSLAIPLLQVSQQPSLHVRYGVRVLSVSFPSWEQPSFWVALPRQVPMLQSQSSRMLLLCSTVLLLLIFVHMENPHTSLEHASDIFCWSFSELVKLTPARSESMHLHHLLTSLEFGHFHQRGELTLSARMGKRRCMIPHSVQPIASASASACFCFCCMPCMYTPPNDER